VDDRAPARRRRVVFAAAAATLVLAGALVARRGPDEPLPATFTVPGTPTGLVAEGGRVWVAAPTAGAVWILDAASGRPAAPPLRTGGTPARLALDARWAWIADTERGALIRAARDGGSMRAFRSGPDIADVTVAAGAVWTVSSADGTARVLDARRRRRVVHVGSHPLALAADARHVVVTDPGGGALVRLSTATRRPSPPIRLGGTPVDVALAGDRAWVADAAAGTVRLVDLTSGRPGRAVPVGVSPVAVAADSAGVYVACRGDRMLVEIDGRTGEVRARVRLAHAPTALALDRRHVWIAAGDHHVIRVDR
jgi:DNA-binding beta-propeller fold protein YncE